MKCLLRNFCENSNPFGDVILPTLRARREQEARAFSHLLESIVRCLDLFTPPGTTGNSRSSALSVSPICGVTRVNLVGPKQGRHLGCS